MSTQSDRLLAENERLRLWAQDALTILEAAHYPPFDQERVPDAIAVIEGLRAALAAPSTETDA
jgi:hypothetical protein